MRQSCLIAVLVLTGAGGPAAAASCDDLWYLRNLIADRAGYCFASALGQAVFDNSDCTTRELRLSAEDMARMEAIRQVEEDFDCRVDTSARVLRDLTPMDWDLIEVIPVPTGYESGCIGYRLGPFALRSAPWPDAAVVGEVRKGVSIGFNYMHEGDWMFVLTDAPSGYMGWAPMDAMPLDGGDACEGWAG